MESAASWIDISGIFRRVYAIANPRWLVGQSLWWEMAPLWGNGCVSTINVLKSRFGQSEPVYATGGTGRQGSSRCKIIFSTEWRHNMEAITRWPFVKGIHWSLMDSPHKGFVTPHKSLSIPLIFTGTNCLNGNRVGTDFRRYDDNVTAKWADVHDDVIKWKHFPRYWPFVRGIHRSPVNSPHKGQWRGALMFSLICVWINSWVNNGKAGDLRRYRVHYDVTVMLAIRICVITST